MKDYYKILHVEPSASYAQIEAAYKRLSEEFKPEPHYPEDSYHVRYYKEIQEAYNVLSDSVKRDAYTKILFENRDKVEDTERKQREEGFGNVLKLLLNDPKAKKGAKKTPPKRISSSGDDSSRKKRSYKTPVLIGLGLIVILAVVFFFFSIDTDRTVDRPEIASVEENEASDTASSRSLLEDNLYGTGEENYEPEDEEAPSHELEDEVGEEMASFSLSDCIELLSDESEEFERKEEAITRALQFFNSNNASVVVLSDNNVQIRRETIEDYLFILMLQSYNIQIVDSQKNQEGKITQLSVKENI